MSDVDSFFERIHTEVEDHVLRDGKEPCYFCESHKDVETHHILPNRFNGSDSESNLVDLCHDCHWKLERLYNKEFWHALGITDPRASVETHLVCEQHQCTNQAVAEYQVSGDSGHVKVAKVWVCAECADDPFGLPQQSEGWHLVRDIRDTGDDNE